MTSETFEKAPRIITPGNERKESWMGFLLILATWVYLYFNVITTLYDGISAFLGYDIITYSVVHAAVGVANNVALSAVDGQVAFGSGKYYALCGFGGMLSCGITHTAIVPLDLIKCRIQVSFIPDFR